MSILWYQKIGGEYEEKKYDVRDVNHVQQNEMENDGQEKKNGTKSKSLSVLSAIHTSVFLQRNIRLPIHSRKRSSAIVWREEAVSERLPDENISQKAQYL